jgi:hypothetical protein
MSLIWLQEYIILGKVVSVCGTVPNLDCRLSGCIVYMTSFLEHMVFWEVGCVANWIRLVCLVAHYCSYSFVCKDAVIGPDPESALVLVSVEG